MKKLISYVIFYILSISSAYAESVLNLNIGAGYADGIWIEGYNTYYQSNNILAIIELDYKVNKNHYIITHVSDMLKNTEIRGNKTHIGGFTGFFYKREFELWRK